MSQWNLQIKELNHLKILHYCKTIIQCCSLRKWLHNRVFDSLLIWLQGDTSISPVVRLKRLCRWKIGAVFILDLSWTMIYARALSKVTYISERERVPSLGTAVVYHWASVVTGVLFEHILSHSLENIIVIIMVTIVILSTLHCQHIFLCLRCSISTFWIYLTWWFQKWHKFSTISSRFLDTEHTAYTSLHFSRP